MKENWREASLNFGRTNTEWLGEFMLVYAPVAIIMLMVLATMSFVLGNGIATNQNFELAWAWASALSVDGVMLALIVRAARPAKSWGYVVTLVTLAPMVVVGVALLALVTMQQTLRINNEQLAIHTLGIDPTTLVVGRAVLTMFAALVGLVFSHMKPVKTHPVTPEPHELSTIVREIVNEMALIPQTAASVMHELPDEPPVNQSEPRTNQAELSMNQYARVKAHYHPGRTYAQIASLSGVPLGSVKRHMPKIKSELSHTGEE